jgi:hypothetical protein
MDVDCPTDLESHARSNFDIQIDLLLLTQVQCGKTEDLQSLQLYGQRMKFTFFNVVSILRAKTDTTKQGYQDHEHNQQQKAASNAHIGALSDTPMGQFCSFMAKRNQAMRCLS